MKDGEMMDHLNSAAGMTEGEVTPAIECAAPSRRVTVAGHVWSGERCYACDKQIRNTPYLVDTRDAQVVFVGPECFKRIRDSGPDGYQPPKGGPRLWTIHGAEPRRKNKVRDELAASLKEMIAVYWGEGDGEEPAPACIQRAKAALAAAER